MKKEEAINTFNKGMMMDFNSLSTPNNILTDCLNGTIITFNGNEYVLQNDMGNGRVESAYLPEGYVPVGIKEHGGIVYVASYNPLTNKGQIGSFPSPERNISDNEVSDSNKVIKKEDFQNTTVNRYELFSDNTIIRSGDRFSIIFKTDASRTDLQKYISNLDNTIDDKICSPKNKLLTISVSVKDNNNNLRDITSDLLRIDNKNEILYSSDPKVRFNSGYFAQFIPTDTILSVDDYRTLKAVNTYNNKIFGELIITAELNTVQAIDVSVSGIHAKNTITLDKSSLPLDVQQWINWDNDQITLEKGHSLLIFQVDYKYNCPDGYYDSQSDDTLDQYVSLYGNESDFFPSNTIKGCTITSSSFQEDPNYGNGYNYLFEHKNKPIYNVSTNLYQQTNYYLVDCSKEGVINYTVTPKTTWDYSLDSISVNGSIDTTKLGTGEATITQWRYIIEDNTIRIGYGFSMYPYYNQEVDYIKLSLYDLINYSESTIKTIQLQKRLSYNGNFQEFIDKDKLDSSVYLVKFECFYKNKGSNIQTTKVLGYRTLITSGIFNEQYYSVTDFANTNRTLNIIPSTDSLDERNLIDQINNGQLISAVDHLESQEYISAYLYQINCILNTTYRLDRENLYPFVLDQTTIQTTYDIDSNQNIQFNSDITYEGNLDSNEIQGIIPVQVNHEITQANPDYAQYYLKLLNNTLEIDLNSISKLIYTTTPSLVSTTNILQKFINSENVDKIFGGSVDTNVKQFLSMYIDWEGLSSGDDYHGFYIDKHTITSSNAQTKTNLVHATQQWESHSDNRGPSICNMYEWKPGQGDFSHQIIVDNFDGNLIGFICSNQLYYTGDGKPDRSGSGGATFSFGNIDTERYPRWQLVLWRTDQGEYILLDRVFLLKTDKNADGTIDTDNDISYAIKQLFDDTYLVQPISDNVQLYVIDQSNYVYNNNYEMHMSIPMRILATFNQNNFKVNNTIYKDVISTNVKKYIHGDDSLTQQIQDNIITQCLFTFPNNSDEEYVLNQGYTFPVVISVIGMNTIYQQAIQIASSGVDTIFISPSGEAYIYDSDGDYFRSGTIYQLVTSNGQESINKIVNKVGTKYEPFIVRSYNGMNMLLLQGGDGFPTYTYFLDSWNNHGEASGDNSNQHTVADIKKYPCIQYSYLDNIFQNVNNYRKVEKLR